MRNRIQEIKERQGLAKNKQYRQTVVNSLKTHIENTNTQNIKASHANAVNQKKQSR